MNPRTFLPITLLVAALTGLTALSIVQAQGTTSTPPSASNSVGVYPAAIINGSCDAPGAVAWTLNDVAAPGAAATINGTPVAGAPAVAVNIDLNATPAAGSAATLSVTEVQVHLTDLEKAPFAIAIKGSSSASNTIACGDIAGQITNNSLSMPIGATNGSDMSGMARFVDDGSGKTIVTIQLSQQAAGAGVPATTPSVPAAGGGAQTTAMVELVDIAFNPKELTISANTDVVVTLNNTGVAMHNFSITDHNNDGVQNLNISVDVQPGQSTTVTINAPAGDYYFFCDVPGHEAAGMHGVLHVV